MREKGELHLDGIACVCSCCRSSQWELDSWFVTQHLCWRLEHPNTYLFCYSQYFYGGGTCYRHCFSEGWLLSVVNLQFGFKGDTVLHQLSVFTLHWPGITCMLNSVDCTVMGFFSLDFLFRWKVQKLLMEMLWIVCVGLCVSFGHIWQDAD